MSSSGLLSNPIYQHSGETEKIPALAQQASVNEDQEQRRRQLDSRGEKQRIVIAKEVSHIIDQFGGQVHLREVPFELPREPLLQQAQQAASQAVQKTIATASSAISTASSATGAVADKVTTATKEVAQQAATTASHIGHDAADYVSTAANTASHIGHDAAGYVTSAAKSASNFVTSAAQGLFQQTSAIAGRVKETTTHTAATIAEKVKDTTTHTAEAVSHKTKELADKAAAKAHEVADNITHFTTLVSVLAEEENERSRRLVSGDEAIMAANAFRISELIRDLGIAFYKQETPNLNYSTKILEETERRWRLHSSTTTRAESNAHLLGKIVKNDLQSFTPRYEWARGHITNLEEAERARRLNDWNEATSILNAFKISSIISNSFAYNQEFSCEYLGFATTLLEENERRVRILEYKAQHVRDASHLLQDLVANNLERFNYTTRNAAQFANEVAHLLGNATKQFASTFSHVTKDIANKTAERVSHAAEDLIHYTNSVYIIALEEKERSRRLSDPAEITAIQNAWAQSQLIRDLPYLYHASSIARFPTWLIEEQERRWRLASITPLASKKLADIALTQHSKFEQASQRWIAKEHARDVAAHSRLNPNAPTFVPHQTQAFTKAEPVIQQSSLRAAGANF